MANRFERINVARQTGLVVVAVYAAAIMGAGCGSGDPPATRPGSTTQGLFVDGSSLGGSCSDSYSATQASSATTPWCTLTHAAQAAPAGSTVQVRQGNYARLTLTSQTRSAFVTFDAYPGEQPVVAGLTLKSSQNWRFKGFKITDTGALTTPAVMLDTGVSNVELINNQITPSGRDASQLPSTCGPGTWICPNAYAVQINAGDSNVLVEGNTVKAPYLGYGLILNSGNGAATISNVTIRDNTFDQGLVQLQIRGYQNVLVEHNELRNLTRYSSPWHSDVIRTYGGGTGLTVRDNYTHDAEGNGFLFKDGVDNDVTLENNIVARIVAPFVALDVYDVNNLKLLNNTVLGSIVFAGNAPGVVMQNNLINSASVTNTAGTTSFQTLDYNWIGGGNPRPAAAPHDVSFAPVFVDKAAGNFDLAPGSPGIDAGTSSGTPTTDLDGTARMDDRTVPNRGGGKTRMYDLGALER